MWLTEEQAWSQEGNELTLGLAGQQEGRGADSRLVTSLLGCDFRWPNLKIAAWGRAVTCVVSVGDFWSHE